MSTALSTALSAAMTATRAGLPLHVQPNPKMVGGEAVPAGVGLIVAAHTHIGAWPDGRQTAAPRFSPPPT